MFLLRHDAPGPSCNLHTAHAPVRRTSSGVAATDAMAGDWVEIGTVGVYDLPKLSTAVIAQGDRVAWDDTAKEIVLPGVGLYPVGVATEAAGNGTATVKVRLDGIATVAA